MATIKYSRIEIMPIVLMALQMVMRMLLKLIFGAIYTGSRTMGHSPQYMADYVDDSKDKLAFIIKESILKIAYCKLCLTNLYKVNNEGIDELHSDEHKVKAANFYYSLIKYDPDREQVHLLKLFFYVEALPYFIYWLGKVIVYEKADLESAYHLGDATENPIKGFRNLRKYDRQEVNFLISLSNSMWKTSDSLTLLMVNN